MTVTIDQHASGFAIPADFAGLSFESANLLPEADGGHLFGPANQRLIDLFRTVGIHSLRLGGAMADRPTAGIPGEQDIDNLFGFAAAAHVKVIYTLRLPRTDPERDAAIARYIDQHYRSQLTCFEIGNEPDYYRRIYREIPDYATYKGLWEKVAAAVTKAVPGARFCGPAAGGITAWSRSFAEDFGPSGRLAAVVQHEYTGGDGNLTGDAPARDAMLSRAWLEQYDRLYMSFAAPAVARGLTYRLEETNNYTGGAKNATDTFTAALWALDYLHWWAAHGAAGINFHNRRWILNTTIYPVNGEDDGLKSGYRLHPIAYGIKAFDLGGHGTAVPVAIGNPDALNLTAYAVRNGTDLWVTLINKKDPGTNPMDAVVTIVAPGAAARGEAVFLTAPDVAAKEGIALGGGSLYDSSWKANWTPVAPDPSGKAPGRPAVKVPGASAAVIRLSLERAQ